MKRYLLLILMLALPVFGQDRKPCVVMAANEPATGVGSWSRVGAQQEHMLTYLAGDYPRGFAFRSSLKDKYVDKIKAKGGRIIILDPHYTREDLEKAKQDCAGR